MSELLVAGAINTDFVATMQRAPEAGETISADGFAQFAGGKGANQAVSAVRNGARVAMVGALGDDAIGAARRADLETAAIDTAWVATRKDASSGVALIFVEAAGENRIAYVPGATLRVTAAWAAEAFRAVKPSLVLTPNELPADALRVLFELARSARVPAVFNVAPYSNAARELAGLADVVVLNQTELAELTGDGSGQIGMAAARLRGDGVSRAVVTLGSEGALVIDGDKVTTICAPTVTVVDSTGAGDALCGALAAALARGEALVDAAAIGVRAGSMACTVAGAQTSSPTLEAIRAAMKSS